MAESDRKSQRFLSELSESSRTELFDNLYQSVVGLHWSSVLREPAAGESDFRRKRGLQVHTASAFLTPLPTSSVLTAVTAGHVISGLLENAKSPTRAVYQFRVMDRGPCPEGTSGVPVRVDSVAKWTTFEKEGDYDYGAMVLPSFEARMILAGGVAAPIPPEMLAEPEEEFDAYVLLGFPSSARTVLREEFDEDSGRMSMSVGCPMLPVTRMPDRNGGAASHPRFIAKIDAWEPRLDNIEGMSGGPVFGLRRDGSSLVIRLVAIQSSWFRDSRTIFAEHAAPFLGALDRQTAELLAKSD